MKDVETAVRAILRSSEELKVVFEALLLRPGERVDNNEGLEDARNKKVLVVVSHRDDWGVHQEGSVFVCSGTSNEPNIEHIFPVTQNFSISIAQMDLPVPDPGVPSVANPGANGTTGFTLTVKSMHGLDLGPEGYTGSLNFFTQNVEEVRAMSRECKELEERHALSVGYKASSDEVGFRWLLPYISKHDLPPMFGIFPQDLRVLNQPLYTRFSPASAGTSGDDTADLQLIKHDWVRQKARESSQKGRRRLKIRLGTFNVNGKMPSQDLSTWVGGMTHTSIPPTGKVTSLSSQEIVKGHCGTSEADLFPPGDATNGVHEITHLDSDPHPDMLVLGFQELDLSTEALIYSTNTSREDAWCRAVFAALGERATSYQKLVSKQLVGMLIVVIVKKTLSSCFDNIRTCVAAAGILGVMGNKGGTGVQLTFTPPADDKAWESGATTLTFINSHLAAFDEMYEKRNSDFQDLSKKLQFFSDILDPTGSAPLPLTVYESDVLFWMGDLNYRIDLSDSDIRTVLSSERPVDDLNLLLKFDQLKKAIHNKKAFDGFSEHPITHLPTYRFNNVIAVDGLGYDMKRKPAWTDRILHMIGPSVEIRQLTYTGHRQITMSDHRPVSADFFVDVQVFDKNLQNETARKLFKSVDFFALSDRANLKLESTTVDLGIVSYNRPVSQTISLQNPGKIPCAYRFVSIDLDSEIHPTWLRIEPMHALMLPDQVVNLTITAYVDNTSASELNLTTRDLAATLILRTITGKDHFLTVIGKYQPTCFTNPLSVLTRLPGPIRSVSCETLRDVGQDRNPLNAPREVMRLVNWLMSADTDIDDLFTSAVDEAVIDSVRECLDTGEEFPFTSQDADPKIVVAFAATLLRLLDSLPEPVVPEDLHSKCVQMTSRDEAFELLDQFPPVSVNVWISVTAFLHYMCSSFPSDNPSEKAKRIATALAPVLLRDDPNSPHAHVSPLGKRNFLLYFMS